MLCSLDGWEALDVSLLASKLAEASDYPLGP